MTGRQEALRAVHVEVVSFGVDQYDALCYEIRRDFLSAKTTPDEYALALSGVLEGAPGAVCHSTSWRYEVDAVVLTYGATPTSLTGLGLGLVEPSVVCSTDPLRPSPDGLHSPHVVAHAARHLADLASRDPTVARVSAQRPRLWVALQQAAVQMPVAPHAQAHNLARLPTPSGFPAAE